MNPVVENDIINKKDKTNNKMNPVVEFQIINLFLKGIGY